MNKIIRWIKDPGRFLSGLLLRLSPVLPDKTYLSCMVWARCGFWPNWKNPQTFNEKLQWLKLYDRRPEYTRMVDKYAVKNYVASIIGKEFIIPTLGVWDRVEDIDWESLPDRFVLKTTHGGGSCGVVICKDKTSFDKQEAINKLRKGFKQNIYRKLREWPYKGVPPRIIAELYIEPKPGEIDLPDYKIFCFDGEPRFCQVTSERGSGVGMCVDFFDKDWAHQPFREPSNFPNAAKEPAKPAHLELMWDSARKLAAGIPFARIDFFDKDDHTYFGEITFFPTSGLGTFSPRDYNMLLGKMITLPGNKHCGR